jgi:hypothetical protein
VRFYFAAELTYPSDKLPALSGIARRTYDERGGAYVAGMWMDEDMLAQLCWRVSVPRMRPVHRASSWAWTSVDGQLGFQTRQSGILDTVYARVLDAQMDLLGADPFGQVRTGCLRLACQGMLEARCVDAATVNIGDTAYPFSPDCLASKTETDRGSKAYLLPLLAGRTDTAVYRNGGDNEPVEEIVVQGLVLSKDLDSDSRFARIGMFQFYKNQAHDYDEAEKEKFESFTQVFDRDATQVAEYACLETIIERKNKYIVYLV